MKQYEVTRLFTHGTLKGLTHTATTVVKFEVGQLYKAIDGCNYKILKCEEIAN